jgi:hypothetical protein
MSSGRQEPAPGRTGAAAHTFRASPSRRVSVPISSHNGQARLSVISAYFPDSGPTESAYTIGNRNILKYFRWPWPLKYSVLIQTFLKLSHNFIRHLNYLCWPADELLVTIHRPRRADELHPSKHAMRLNAACAGFLSGK